MTPRPGGWEFIWPDSIFIRVERLREHHDAVTAELWAEQGEAREHLVGGLRFNLTTPGGRASMAKALLARRNGYDWGGMMEQVCVFALAQFRAQEEPTIIGSLPTRQPLLFRLAPVLPEGVSTLLFGYGGMAKTTIGVAWGLLVYLGLPRLGLEPHQAPVLLLDWETNRDIANKLVAKIQAGTDLPGTAEFLYRRCRRPLLEFVEDVRADVQREGIGLVILDSLAKACGGEKMLREDALPTMSALEWLGTTNLIISHRPKGLEGQERGSYGSVYVENDVRQAFRVEAHPEPGGNSAQIALFHTKFNLMGQLKPIGYQITWDDFYGTKIETKDVGEMEDVRGQLAAVYQVEIALKSSPLTVDDLAEATGLKADTIRKTLARYKNKRFVPLGDARPQVWGRVIQTPEEFR